LASVVPFESLTFLNSPALARPYTTRSENHHQNHDKPKNSMRYWARGRNISGKRLIAAAPINTPGTEPIPPINTMENIIARFHKTKTFRRDNHQLAGVNISGHTCQCRANDKSQQFV
jgi:hypothetical protein